MLELAAAVALAGKPTGEILVAAPPTTLHPLYAWSDDDRRLHDRLYPRIVDLAELTADGTSVAVTLARGREWWDGEPVVAADVCATIERARAEDRPSAYTAATRARVASCAADPDDELRATIALTAPEDPRSALAIPLLPAHHPAFVNAGPDLGAVPPLGAGPWRAERDGQGWLLTGPTGRIRWAVDPDPVSAFVAGRGVEVVVPPARLAEVRGVPGVQLGVGPPVIWALFVNTGKGALADPRVREALDRLIDREALGTAVLGVEAAGSAARRPWTPVSGPFPPGSPSASAGVPVPTRSPDRASALLTAAGVVPGEWTLRIAVPSGRAPAGFTAALQSALGGITLTEVPLDGSQWWFSLEAGAHAAVTDLALVPLTGDPSPWFHTRTATAGWSNPFGSADPPSDALLERASRGDADAGQALHGRLADLRPALFLWVTSDRIASRLPDSPRSSSPPR